MPQKQGKKKRQPGVDPVAKIGSGYMATIEGQPALENTVEIVSGKADLKTRKAKQ